MSVELTFVKYVSVTLGNFILTFQYFVINIRSVTISNAEHTFQ